MRIVLIGGEFHNRGSEAMILSVIATLKDRSPQSNFTVISYPSIPPRYQNSPDYIAVQDHIQKKPLYLLFAIIAAILPFRLLPYFQQKNKIFNIFASADLIIDVSGYAITEAFGFLRVVLFCMEILISRLLKVPYILYPQSIGKISSTPSRLILRLILPLADLIMVRGRLSERHLLDLQIPSQKIIVCSDIAFLFANPSESDRRNIHRLYSIPKQNAIGIIPNTRIFERCQTSTGNSYISLLVDLIKHVTNTLHATAILIPHEFYSSSVDDRYVIRRILEALPSETPAMSVLEDLDSNGLKAIIGTLDLLITSRYHSIIAATSQCIPTLVIGWSQKYEELMVDLQIEEYLSDYEHFALNKIQNKLSFLWQNRLKIRNSLCKRIPAIKKKAQLPGMMVQELLDKEQSFTQEGEIKNQN